MAAQQRQYRWDKRKKRYVQDAGGGGGGGAAGLYSAAVTLKGLLRGRAALLLLDRTDIATAVEADGVVLSPAGAFS